MANEFKIVSLLNPGGITQGVLALTLGGNTDGVLALVSTGTLFLAGGANITLSQNANSVSIVGGAGGGGGAPIGTAVKAVASVGSTGTITRYAPEDHQHKGVAAFAVTNTGNTLGDTRSQVGTLFIAASGGITASQSTAAAGNDTVWLSVAAPIAQSVQTQNVVDVTLGGNTAGVLALISSGTLFLAGGNNITVSQNGQSVTLSGANAGGAQTGISGIVASDATYSSGTVTFSGVGGGVTINSNTGQRVDVSVATPVPIGTAVKAVASVGSTGTITRYAPEDHQHAGVAAFAVTNTGNTAGNTRSQVGTLFLAASGGITASQSTAAAGNDTVWLSVAAVVAQTTQSAIKAFGASNTGNTAGNTGVSTGIDWVLAGTNNVTISESTAAGGPNTLWVSAAGGAGVIATAVKAVASVGSTGTITRFAPEDHQHAGVAAFAVTNTGNTLGNTRSQVGTLFFAASGGITASQSTAAAGNDTVWVSVATPVPIGTAVKDVASVGSTGTITRYAPEDHQHKGVVAYAITNTGNTLGNTQSQVGTLFLAASGGLTASQSTGAAGNDTLWLSAPATSSIVGVSPVSISTAGSTISVLLNAMSQYDPFDAINAYITNSTLGQSSLFFVPFDLPYQLSASRLNVFLSVATLQSAAASSGSGSIGIGYGLYSRGTGASSERLMSLTSYSAAIISFTASSDSRYGATHYAGLSNATSHTTATTAISSSNASTYALNSIGGYRVVALPLNLTMTPGRYWLGLSQQSTNNAAASWSVGASYLQQTVSNWIAYRPFGTSSAASNASVYGVLDGLGTYSAQSAGWPVSIGLSNSDIRGGVSNTIPIFNFSGISTSSNLL